MWITSFSLLFLFIYLCIIYSISSSLNWYLKIIEVFCCYSTLVSLRVFYLLLFHFFSTSSSFTQKIPRVNQTNNRVKEWILRIIWDRLIGLKMLGLRLKIVFSIFYVFVVLWYYFKEKWDCFCCCCFNSFLFPRLFNL